jgi:hypothetical protein
MLRLHCVLLAGLALAASAVGAFFIAPASAAEKTAVVKDLTVTLGPAVYRIRRLEAQGTTLSEPELAQIFDQKDATLAKDRFARLNAKRIVIPEIAGEAEAVGVKQHFVYRDLVLENVNAGRIGALRAASLEQTADRPKGGRIEARYGQIICKNIDLAQIAHVYGEARADENEAVKPLQDEVAVESATFAIPDAQIEFRVARISMRGLKARAFLRPPSAWFAQASDGAAPATEQSAALAVAALNAVSGLEIEGVEARDLVLTGVAAGPGGKPYALKFGRVKLSNLAGSVVGDLSIDDFSFASEQLGDVKLRHVALRGFDLRPFFEQSERRFPRLAHIDVSDFGADLMDQEAGDSAREKFRLAAAEADFSAYRDGVPTKFVAKVERFVIDLSASAGAPADAQLIALGYRDIDLSGTLEGEWREKEQQFIVRQATLDGRDMGKLQLSAILTNVAGLVFSPNSAIARAAALAVLLQRVEASFENKGIVEKTLELEAKTRRADPAKLRADYASAAEAVVSALFDGSEKGRIIGGAVAKFVATPKQLHLRLESARGVGALDALTSNPGEILQGLDVDATATQ